MKKLFIFASIMLVTFILSSPESFAGARHKERHKERHQHKHHGKHHKHESSTTIRSRVGGRAGLFSGRGIFSTRVSPACPPGGCPVSFR